MYCNFFIINFIECYVDMCKGSFGIELMVYILIKWIFFSEEIIDVDDDEEGEEDVDDDDRELKELSFDRDNDDRDENDDVSDDNEEIKMKFS